ncbi:hypothetical protein ACFSC4_26295 [Deinococcus malanensis]|uniref:tetratricopeptide repeat protein n=1 Tax=Deinococcus malanensis TaxID=1706855 RepID=UPI00362629C9
MATSRLAPPEPFEAQAIERLTLEDTTSLLKQTLGASLPDDAVSWIGQHASGNPLFSIEYLRFLIRQGCLWNDGQRWHWREPRENRIPAGVEALVSHLCHTPPLSQAAEAALQARAMLASDMSPAIWAQVAGLGASELQGACEELGRRGILRAGQFVHPLYQDVEVHHLTRARRQVIARRAVSVLLKSDVEAAAGFAMHAELPAAEALPLLRRAAESAQDGGRHRQAAEYLSWAVRHADEPDRAPLALAAARLWRAFEPRQVIALAQQVLETEPENLEAAFLLAGALVLQGDEERANRLIRNLQGSSGLEASWLFELVSLHADRNDYAGVMTQWQEHPQLHSLAPPSVQAQVIRALDFMGRSTEACALAAQALGKPALPDAERTVLLLPGAGPCTAPETWRRPRRTQAKS